MDELEELARHRIGTVLRERYRVESLLGMGGMASVYRGAHRNGNRVALKVLHADLAKSRELCSRFLKEGYVANAVEHSGAVRVLDDDVASDGAPFLVMELLEGETVDARHQARSRRLPLAEVAKVAHDVLDVLEAAHAKTIVHRDLKPENLFLTRNGELKVLDFGIARMRDGLGTSWTRSGTAMGTPAYMAPEQAMGLSREVDGRVDLWGLGATMFTLLSAAFVHEAETVQQLLIFAATQPARSIRSVVPDTPAPFAELIDRALSFEKAARFQDAATMRRAIVNAYAATFGAPLVGAATRLEVVVKPAEAAGEASSDATTRREGPGAVARNKPAFLAPTVDAVSARIGASPMVLAPTLESRPPARPIPVTLMVASGRTQARARTARQTRAEAAEPVAPPAAPPRGTAAKAAPAWSSSPTQSIERATRVRESSPRTSVADREGAGDRSAPRGR